MIQWMDNFSAYGLDANNLLNGPYAQILNSTSLDVDPDPDVTGNVIKVNNPIGDGGLRRVLSSPQVTSRLAIRLWMRSLPVTEAARPVVAMWKDNANAVLCYVWVSTTGELVATNHAGTELGRTAGPVLVANAWQHIESEATINAATGAIEVRVEGVPVLELTGKNTGVNPTAQFVFGASTNGSEVAACYFKDLIISDNTGASNTDFLGSCSVVSLVPTSDVSIGGWVPSSGTTGWNLIDEAPPNDETDYISADDSPPAACSFEVSNLPVDVTSVKGLMTMVRSRKTDGGDATLQASLISDSTPDDGADRPITVAFTYWTDMFETDPATSAAWTPAAVDAVQLSLNRTT